MKDAEAKFFVYFAENSAGLIKIGTSSNVRRRVSALKSRLLHTIEGGSFRECAVHFLLRRHNCEGEYFYQSPEVMSFIESLKQGDYRGLIDDLPYTHHQYCTYGPLALRKIKCFKRARVSLGLTHEQVAAEAGIALSSAASADGLTAPSRLTGRLIQYIVGKAAEQGVVLNSHHFTGRYDAELEGKLEYLDARNEKAKLSTTPHTTEGGRAAA